MSIATELMRQASDSPEVSAYKDDAGWHGIEYVNHPTPSGSPRYLPTYSDNRAWPDEGTAIAEFKKVLAQIAEARAKHPLFGESDGKKKKKKGKKA